MKQPLMKVEIPLLMAAIGHTPLIELGVIRSFARRTRLFAKLESVNPGGSIKDRPVARMMRVGLASGKLSGGRRLLDSSSGNAGISYAMLGAALGVPVTLVVPGNASTERLERIRAYGAELILTDPLEGYDFAVRKAQRLALEHPDRYWYCDQYSNTDNWRAHYADTAGELLDQLDPITGGPPDAFVAGVGTGGTLTGVGRRLKELRAATLVVAAIPEAFPGIEGLKPLGAPQDMVPAILDESLIDEHVPVRLDDALAMCRRLAGEGVFVGPSSGAFVQIACELAHRRDLDSIATVLADSGERYLSTAMWRAA